jgi:hypothetical protein
MGFKLFEFTSGLVLFLLVVMPPAWWPMKASEQSIWIASSLCTTG